MPYRLLKYGLNSHRQPERMWRTSEPRDSYDVVIIGGGVHGLACAYYLAKDHGITNIAVLESGYIGGGGSGRNTAIIRSNYLTPEGARFYDESVKLYENLSQTLDFNLMFSQRGHLTLAHSDASLRIMRQRAETNQICGIDSRVLTPKEVKEIVPHLDTSDRPRYPILGALYHPPGGIIRHDAVVWGYARGADRRGVDILQQTACEDILVEGGRVVGVNTNRGRIKTNKVHNATAGWCTTITDMVGVRLPVVTHPLQACVSEPLKPFLDSIIVSGTLHVYVSQSDRGELVMGASIDPYASYSMDSTLGFLEGLCAHILELFPMLHNVRILRQWAGICDMTPDYSPIIGLTSVKGFTVDVGWGTYGFKAGPVAGKYCAELIATDQVSDSIAPFRLARFAEGKLVGEKGAASVGH
ncbi:MAG: FAD-dependent oxidoreductase [Candidatus Bipolaricaulia bacterium]